MAKNSIANDELGRAQEEIRTRGSCISMLEADKSCLETKCQVQSQNIKDFKHRLKTLKDESDNKETVNVRNVKQIEIFEKNINQLDKKLKTSW